MPKRYRVGIDVGGTKIAFGLYDAHMNEIASTRVPSDITQLPEVMLKSMVYRMRALAKGAGIPFDNIAGVGIAMPSHIDYEQGLVVNSSNLPLWHNVRARDILSAKLGMPVWLDNDANVASWAEFRMGAGRGARHMLYLTLSTGIGGSIIINGEIYRGDHGAAGEFGHILVSDQYGFPCGCGNVGCVESICGGLHLAQYVVHCMEQGQSSIIAELAGGAELITAHHIKAANDMGDPLAAQAIRHCAEYLGRMFASLYQAFNIKTIVYGGGLTNLGPDLTDRMVERFRHYMPLSRNYPVNFMPAQLGENTGVMGAALLVSDDGGHIR